MQARVHLLVHGRVQGVFFRSGTEETAAQLGLKGWVKNLHDGSVEITAEGEKSALEKLVDWCRNGPPGARVASVEVKWVDYAGEFADFRTAW